MREERQRKQGGWTEGQRVKKGKNEEFNKESNRKKSMRGQQDERERERSRKEKRGSRGTKQMPGGIK